MNSSLKCCPDCGKEIYKGRYCIYCGFDYESYIPKPESKQTENNTTDETPATSTAEETYTPPDKEPPIIHISHQDDISIPSTPQSKKEIKTGSSSANNITSVIFAVIVIILIFIFFKTRDTKSQTQLHSASTSMPQAVGLSIPQYYYLDDNYMYSSEQWYGPGRSSIISNFSSGYDLVKTSPSYIYIDNNNSANTDAVALYYKTHATTPPRTATPSRTQTAVISKEKIFPRPGPNVGKNEYNYEVQGQTVTVHSRAKDQQGGSKWWVCFSGALYCEGRVFNLDHMWISESYLEPTSYDLYALPIDSAYFN